MRQRSESVDFQIDRDLPIPIRQQLKGMIEYGIATGVLKPGETLPSVRELAMQLGIAPMTVSQVYGDLKGQGLIETRAGSGTLVAEAGQGRSAANAAMAQLHRHIDALTDEAIGLGVRLSDLAGIIHARLQARASLGSVARIVMVGLFPQATQRYARMIAAQLGEEATVEAATFEAIRSEPEIRARVAAADAAVTFVNREQELALLVSSARVLGLRFIPSLETRRALGVIEPLARVLLVAQLSEFLPVMRDGFRRYAPHVVQVSGIPARGRDLPIRRIDTDLVIYASGTEEVLDLVEPGIQAIEYTHRPDPEDVSRLLVPLLKPRSEAVSQSLDDL